MTKDEWLTRYEARMIERGLTQKEAKEAIDAIKDEPDLLNDDPEDVADEELSYMSSDG